MSYSQENALYQWREGERRVRETNEPARADLERAADAVVEELRFVLSELVDFYGADTDWATDLAGRHAAGTDAATVVDAAFSRYAREASDFAGGRARETHARP